MANYLRKTDAHVYHLIQKEARRQTEGLEMIPSENYVSPAVLQAMGSILTNKYSEGYPKKRYYGGNQVIDEVELLAIERAKKLFQVPHVNVQPYSGSPANLAVYLSTCQPGDCVMGLNLPDGGHLTHGWKVSATGIFFKTIPYHVTRDGRVDFDEVWMLAKKYKPKLIWTGATAYVYQYEFDKFAEIADSVKAYYAADIAHTAGLVVSKVHADPVPFAHIVTTTTHKTLRGPRGGMIMVTKKGIDFDPDLPNKVDRAVFPALQGGPHDHTTAAIAVCLKEASNKKFKKYAAQIVRNAKFLANELKKHGFTLVGNGTEVHMVLIDLTPIFGPGGGIFMQLALDRIGISVNKNTIPNEPLSPFYPSGIRLGTPCVTTRGMKEKEMKLIASWYQRIVERISSACLPKEKEERIFYLKDFHKKIDRDRQLKSLRKEVREFALKFPVPAIV